MMISDYKVKLMQIFQYDKKRTTSFFFNPDNKEILKESAKSVHKLIQRRIRDNCKITNRLLHYNTNNNNL